MFFISFDTTLCTCIVLKWP